MAASRALRAIAACLLVFGVVLASHGEVQAHAFPERHDLPLPLPWYLAGAGAAVLVSFVAAAGLVRAPARPREIVIALPPRVSGALPAVLRAASVATFALLLAAGLFGEQRHWEHNLLPVAVWVAWWVGLAFVCALAGNLWALINPWVAVGRWASALNARARGGRAPRFRLPGRVGSWPAVGLFLVFAWAELAWPSNTVPARLACAILLYSAVTWAGMAAFGVREWTRAGEVFSLVFGLFARFAPLDARRDDDGRAVLVVRPYGAGLAHAPRPSLSMSALVIAVLATVSFDGISETMQWARVSGAGVGLLYDAGLVRHLGYANAGALVKTAGLLAAVAAFALAYLAVAAFVARLDGARTGDVARAFVYSLVPIAIGYHLAHYFSYLLVEGRMVPALLSDPFGWGWDLFGTAAHTVDAMELDMRLIWLVTAGGIVAGHAVAVFLAHRAALETALRPRHVAVSQLPLVVLMIAYTMLSLWIMAQPVVET